MFGVPAVSAWHVVCWLIRDVKDGSVIFAVCICCSVHAAVRPCCVKVGYIIYSHDGVGSFWCDAMCIRFCYCWVGWPALLLQELPECSLAACPANKQASITLYVVSSTDCLWVGSEQQRPVAVGSAWLGIR